MTTMNATCMSCGKTWKFDPAKVEFDVPYEAGDELVAALCETCAGTVDADQMVARLKQLRPERIRFQQMSSDEAAKEKRLRQGAIDSVVEQGADRKYLESLSLQEFVVWAADHVEGVRAQLLRTEIGWDDKHPAFPKEN